ncbi:MAG TPA: helix-turn-helix domain-containing protein, partial [Amycolatopsis sp.]
MTSVKPRRSDATRAAILGAARERFAADGYERATIRAIAADAGIDPSMVMRYYGSKEGLFAAAVDVDLQLPDPREWPREEVGSRLAAHIVSRWEGALSDELITLLLRSAGTNQAAAEQLRRHQPGPHRHLRRVRAQLRHLRRDLVRDDRAEPLRCHLVRDAG